MDTRYNKKPDYGRLLPPSYQKGTAEIYINPSFASYTPRTTTADIYEGMLPAGANPMTALQVYGPSNMPPSQLIRLRAANKSNIETVKAEMNKSIMKKYENKKKEQIKVIKKVEEKIKKEVKNQIVAQEIKKVLGEKKKELRKEVKKAKDAGKKIIKEQKVKAAVDAKNAEEAKAFGLGSMHGLGWRPDYTSIMPPAMKGELIDIYGRGSNYVTIADLNKRGLGEISLYTDIVKDIAIAGIVAGGLYYLWCKNC